LFETLSSLYIGMYVEATSNGFIVDDTPPIFTTNLTMAQIGTIKMEQP
jgi:hypothetical protein